MFPVPERHNCQTDSFAWMEKDLVIKNARRTLDRVKKVRENAVLEVAKEMSKRFWNKFFGHKSPQDIVQEIKDGTRKLDMFDTISYSSARASMSDTVDAAMRLLSVCQSTPEILVLVSSRDWEMIFHEKE